MSNRSIFVKNFSANLLLQITTVVSGFILPPLIILHYGSTVNGMLVSVKQLIAYLDILEAGIGASSIALLYKPLFEKNAARRNQILAATHRFYRLIGLIFFVLLIILAVGYSYLIRQQIPYTTTFMVILLLGMVNVLDFLTIATYRILLQADHKTAVLSYTQTGITLLNVLVCWQLIVHDTGNTGLIDLQIAFFLVSLIRFVLISAYTHKKYPDLSLKPISRISLRDIPQKRDVFIYKAVALINYVIPLIIISIFCGLKDASIYAVYWLIFNAIKLLLHSLSNGMGSIFGHTLADSEQNKNTTTIFNRYENLYFTIVSFLYTCVLILALPFISIYTQDMVDANYYQPILIWLFVLYGLTDLRIPSDLLCNASANFKILRQRAFIELIINLPLSLVLVHYIGFYGVLVAGICTFFYSTIKIISYTDRHLLNRRKTISLKKIIIVIIPLIIVFQLQNSNLLTLKMDSYVSWLITSTLVSSLCAISSFAIYKVLIKIN